MTEPFATSPKSGAGVPHRPRPEDTSVGDLVSDISSNLSTLMRQEVALAKAEARESAAQAGKGAGMMAGAAVAAQFLLLFLSIALWWGLAVAMGDRNDPALIGAALIVAVIWAVIALVLFLTGRSQLRRMEGMPQTVDTVRHIPGALKGDETV